MVNKRIKDNFFGQVYKIVKKIPKGKVMTYGQIAAILGSKDARKVGWALHGNRNPEIPCHRVVNKDGKVAANYSFGGWKEQRLKLTEEGVGFLNDLQVDLVNYLFNARSAT